MSDADLKVLLTTTEAGERNAAALRLAERQVPQAKAALIGLIEREDLRDHRGTLIRSLGHFDCSDQVGLLVDLVITGNFEASHEAFEILDLIDHVDGEDLEAALDAAEAALKGRSLDGWRRALLEELIDAFD